MSRGSYDYRLAGRWSLHLVRWGLACVLGFGLVTMAAAAEIELPAMEGSIGNPRGAEDQSGFSDEYPTHPAFVTAFSLEAREITKSQWDEVRAWGLANGYADLPVGSGGAGTDPEQAENHPVVDVSWYDAIKWCNARSERDGFSPVYQMEGGSWEVYRTGMAPHVQAFWNNTGYRLPTEREWELAARGGVAGQDYPWSGASVFFRENIAGDQAQFQAGGTVPPEQFPANGFGLFDMAGNVAEWCWDWYAEDACAHPFPAGPQEPGLEQSKAVRGGCWRSEAMDLRVAARSATRPDQRRNEIGFRTARSRMFFSQSSGPFSGGNLVTITNGHFGAITNVRVGHVDATPENSGADWFTLVMPAQGAAGPVDIVVQTSDLGDITLSAAYFYAKADPEVTAWPTANSITYGQTLADSILGSGAATPDGTFVFANPATAPGAGTHWAELVFIPADADNYNAMTGSVEVVVAKALLTVAADPQTKPQGEPNPPLTFQYSGFVMGEDASVLETEPVIATIVDETTPAGLYVAAITVTGGAAANYEFQHLAADFAVTAEGDPVTIELLSSDFSDMQVTFGPVTARATCYLEYRASLATGDWEVVASEAVDAGQNSVALAHAGAEADIGFYRIRIAIATGP